MKAIMISINPKWVAKILNGEKTIEIRKRFPKDYVGWVYIYCTKGGKQLVDCPQWVENELYHQLWYDKDVALLENSQMLLNGKIVARFWCDKVEEYFGGAYVIHNSLNYPFEDLRKDVLENVHKEDKERLEELEELEWYEQFLKDTQLTREELRKYVAYKDFSAIHITKLEIFDKPKEISEFKRCTEKVCIYNECHKYMHCLKSLTRASQSWCYVEV